MAVRNGTFRMFLGVWLLEVGPAKCFGTICRNRIRLVRDWSAECFQKRIQKERVFHNTRSFFDFESTEGSKVSAFDQGDVHDAA